MKKVHVYPLSRLVHAPAPNWEKLLQSIEDGRTRAFGYYQPMREASVLYCSKQGKGRDKIASDMLARAHLFGGKRANSVAADNAAAFDVFTSVFYPMIHKYRRHFLRDAQSGCAFNGIQLIGAPHLEVEDSKGRIRHAVFFPSVWADNDLKAYLELMSVIVENCFGGDPSSLWPLDLKSGKQITWKPSVRMRQRCALAARHYGRLINLFEGS